MRSSFRHGLVSAVIRHKRISSRATFEQSRHTRKLVLCTQVARPTPESPCKSERAVCGAFWTSCQESELHLQFVPITGVCDGAVSIAAAGRFVGSGTCKGGPCASRLSVRESMCFLLGDQRRIHVPTKNHRASPGMDRRKIAASSSGIPEEVFTRAPLNQIAQSKRT